MSKFNGFSQDEIKNIAKTQAAPKNIKKIAKPTATSVTVANNNDAVNKSTTDTSHFQSIMHPIQEAVHFRPVTTKPVDESSILHLEPRTTVPVPLEPDNYNNNPENMLEPTTDLYEPTLPFRGVSLKDFEQQRKLMEEQNKQKRHMLMTAIDKHAQKTEAEAKKLQEIKKELGKLDSELASDVGILRKQIEMASLQFLNVQKHYDQVEAQFLKAKIDLHQASEKKEMLTEHLCAIISHNEERKAKRLTELMDKIGLSLNGEMAQDDGGM